MAIKQTQIRFTDKRYLSIRKSLLKEERNLLYTRDKINKDLRELRKTLYQWDTAFLNK